MKGYKIERKQTSCYNEYFPPGSKVLRSNISPALASYWSTYQHPPMLAWLVRLLLTGVEVRLKFTFFNSNLAELASCFFIGGDLK